MFNEERRNAQLKAEIAQLDLHAENKQLELERENKQLKAELLKLKSQQAPGQGAAAVAAVKPTVAEPVTKGQTVSERRRAFLAADREQNVRIAAISREWSATSAAVRQETSPGATVAAQQAAEEQELDTLFSQAVKSHNARVAGEQVPMPVSRLSSSSPEQK